MEDNQMHHLFLRRALAAISRSSTPRRPGATWNWRVCPSLRMISCLGLSLGRRTASSPFSAALAPGVRDVEQAVQHAPHVGCPGAPAGLGWGNELLDQAILVIAEGLTGAKVSNPCTILGHPHRSLLKEEVCSSKQLSTQPFILAQLGRPRF